MLKLRRLAPWIYAVFTSGLIIFFQNFSWLPQQEIIYTPAALGIGEPILDSTFSRGTPVSVQLNALLKYKPAVFRMWMPTGELFDTYGVLNTNKVGIAKSAVRSLVNARVSILGMDHRFPSWMTGSQDTENWNAIPCRDLSNGSRYIAFLEKYKSTWYTLAKTFPEIKAWEPANETNGPHSFTPLQVGPGSCGKKIFTLDERVLITLDLLFQARYSIHLANPQATVFLPPPAPVDENGNLDTTQTWTKIFIQSIYQKIAWGGHWSKNARDYFDGVSWHPYIFQKPTFENWVLPNIAIYNVLQQYGDKDIPIIISEVGNSEYNPNPKEPGKAVELSQETVAEWMRLTIQLSRENFPWLKTLIWFRGMDDLTIRWGPWDGKMEQRFGILSDISLNYKPKAAASVFCQATSCGQKAGWYKAWVKVGTINTWSVFYINAVGQYCQTNRPDLFAQMASLPVGDVNNQTYVGYCQ